MSSLQSLFRPVSPVPPALRAVATLAGGHSGSGRFTGSLLVVVGIDGLQFPARISPYELPPEPPVARALRSMTGWGVSTAVISEHPLDFVKSYFPAEPRTGAVREIRASGGREEQTEYETRLTQGVESRVKDVAAAYRALQQNPQLQAMNVTAHYVGARRLSVVATAPEFDARARGDDAVLASIHLREAFEGVAKDYGLECRHGIKGSTLLIPGFFGPGPAAAGLLSKVSNGGRVLLFGSTPGDSRMFAAVKDALAAREGVQHVSVLARGPETTATDRSRADLDVEGTAGLEGMLDTVRQLVSGELANGSAERELRRYVAVDLAGPKQVVNLL